MSRIEEIQNYAYNNCINDDIDDTSYSLIVETARWADQTMIEKTYKWIINNMPKYVKAHQLDVFINNLDMASDFRKAMEE